MSKQTSIQTNFPKWTSVFGGFKNLPQIGEEVIAACYDDNTGHGDKPCSENHQYRIETMRYWGHGYVNTAQGMKWKISFGPIPKFSTWLWITHWIPAPKLPSPEEMQEIGEIQRQIHKCVCDRYPLNDKEQINKNYITAHELFDALITLSDEHTCKTCTYAKFAKPEAERDNDRCCSMCDYRKATKLVAALASRGEE